MSLPDEDPPLPRPGPSERAASYRKAPVPLNLPPAVREPDASLPERLVRGLLRSKVRKLLLAIAIAVGIFGVRCAEKIDALLGTQAVPSTLHSLTAGDPDAVELRNVRVEALRDWRIRVEGEAVPRKDLDGEVTVRCRLMIAGKPNGEAESRHDRYARGGIHAGDVIPFKVELRVFHQIYGTKGAHIEIAQYPPGGDVECEVTHAR